MNVIFGLLFFAIFYQCSADEIVQPPIIPHELQIPGLAALTEESQQLHDAHALQQVALVMDKAFAKAEARGVDVTKTKETKSSVEQPDKNKEAMRQYAYTEEQLLAMTTEFLRAPEFSAPITIKTKKISIREALIVLGKQAGVTILIDHAVTGEIPSLNAEEVPVRALIQVVLDAHKPQLVMMHVGGAWRVVPKARADELGRAIIQGDIVADRQTATIKIIEATWDNKLKETLKDLWSGITGEGHGKRETFLLFDDISNVIVASGRSSHVEQFKDLVAALDKAVPQIRLDIRIIYADKNFENDFGVQWSGLYDRRAWAGKFGLAGFGIGDIVPASATSQTSPPPNPAQELPGVKVINTNNTDGNGLFSDLLGWTLNSIPAQLVSKAGKGIKFPITFGGRNLEWGRLNLELMAAEQRGEMKTILKPTLLVSNQESAEILVGQQLPHQVNVQENVAGSVVNAASTAYKDIGTKIQVKPAAMVATNEVALDVYIEHSYITNQQQTPLLSQEGDSRGTYKYSVELAKTKSKVVLKNGQTTMLSGLMMKLQEQIETGVPFLKDIPLIGVLFKNKFSFLSDKQLLIFITPTLVTSESVTESQNPEEAQAYHRF